MVVAQQTRHIQSIAKAAEGKRDADAQTVRKGAREEADDGEGGVEGGERVVGGLCVDLATSAEAVDGVEHAGAEEADEGDEEELHLGRGVPGGVEGAQLWGLVHPALGAGEGRGVVLVAGFGLGGDVWGGVGDGVGGGLLGVRHCGGLVVCCRYIWRW